MTVKIDKDGYPEIEFLFGIDEPVISPGYFGVQYSVVDPYSPRAILEVRLQNKHMSVPAIVAPATLEELQKIADEINDFLVYAQRDTGS